MRFSTRIAGAVAAAGIAVLGATACTPAQIQAAQAQQSSSAGSRAVSAAQSVLGSPFVWGGSSPGGFDCSGLTRWSYGQAGVYLPGGSYNQINYGYPVGWNDLRRGDLVFYGPGGSQHVAMYYGNGQVIQASNEYTGVHIASIYYIGNPTAFRRIG
ncbi:MAG: C40 family peptidase [Candidatus Nanopelagicales bacterium]